MAALGGRALIRLGRDGLSSVHRGRWLGLTLRRLPQGATDRSPLVPSLLTAACHRALGGTPRRSEGPHNRGWLVTTATRQAQKPWLVIVGVLVGGQARGLWAAAMEAGAGLAHGGHSRQGGIHCAALLVLPNAADWLHRHADAGAPGGWSATAGGRRREARLAYAPLSRLSDLDLRVAAALTALARNHKSSDRHLARSERCGSLGGRRLRPTRGLHRIQIRRAQNGWGERIRTSYLGLSAVAPRVGGRAYRHHLSADRPRVIASRVAIRRGGAPSVRSRVSDLPHSAGPGVERGRFAARGWLPLPPPPDE
jgi:hypothetical protein